MENIPEELVNEVIEAVEIRIKYAGYINREITIAEKLSRLDNIKIENKFDYATILSLSTEAREKTNENKSENNWASSTYSGNISQ